SRLEGSLVGGLYGVAIGGAIFGTSMSIREKNRTKKLHVHLAMKHRAGGISMLDIQYSTPHIEQFGVAKMTRLEYESRLVRALIREASWWPEDSFPQTANWNG